MPRWTRDPAALRDRYPDERWTGVCPPAAVAMLLRYDHHVVWIGERPALLLTYPWAVEGLADSAAPLAFEVSFTYARGHPPAPREVQAVVDQIAFAP